VNLFVALLHMIDEQRSKLGVQSHEGSARRVAGRVVALMAPHNVPCADQG
jgi:hypothetical protein